MTYALGRSLDYRDMPTVRRIVRQAAADDYRFKSIVLGVVSSDAFRKREGDPPSLAPTAARATAGKTASNPDRRTLVMFLTRKHLSRRTVLKGAGATIALPLLDAMIPAGTALAQTAAAASPRLGFVYFPHGALQDQWTPTPGRARLRLSRSSSSRWSRCATTSPWSAACATRAGRARSPHGIIEETWLSCVSPRRATPRPASASRSIRLRRGTWARTRRCRRWNCAASRAA